MSGISKPPLVPEYRDAFVTVDLDPWFGAESKRGVVGFVAMSCRTLRQPDAEPRLRPVFFTTMAGRAPKGGVTIGGKFYDGGRFVTGQSQEQVDQAAASAAAQPDKTGAGFVSPNVDVGMSIRQSAERFRSRHQQAMKQAFFDVGNDLKLHQRQNDMVELSRLLDELKLEHRTVALLSDGEVRLWLVESNFNRDLEKGIKSLEQNLGPLKFTIGRAEQLGDSATWDRRAARAIDK